jgi:simple sugar transport system permease protein
MRELLRQAFAPRSSRLQSVILPLAAVLAALGVGGVMIAVAGFKPLEIYASMLESAVGTPQGLGVSVTNAIPLILAGLGVALPFRCGLLNIGGEGQIYIGALFATLVGLGLHGLPPAIHLPLALMAGFIGGGLWGAIPGSLRASRGLSEIIVTIMLNYVGFWIVSYLVHGPLKDPESYGYSWTMKVPVTAQLPLIFAEARINLGIVVAFLAAAVSHFLLSHTVPGFEMRAVGAGAQTARFAGIRVGRSTVLSMVLGGGLAGLAGTAVILGVQYRLSDFFSSGYGFTAIAVALVGQTSPIGVVFAGLFFGGLQNGVNSAQRSLGIPMGVALSLQGLILLFMIAGQSATLIRWLRKRRTARRVDSTQPAVLLD